MTDLVLYDLAPSPNNVKARLALGYKDLPYRKVSVPLGGDRSMVLEASGQSLTPVLLHGKTIVYDSYAILRYLEANFPETPRIYSPDRDTQHEIEGWEIWARTELSEPIALVFQQAFADDPSEEALERAQRLFGQATARLERRLEEGPYLLGETLTAADLTAAPFVVTGLVSDEMATAGGILAFFHQHLRPPEEHRRTREWVGRLMAYDRMPAGSPE